VVISAALARSRDVELRADPPRVDAAGRQSIKEARADLMRTIEVCFGDRVGLLERTAGLDDEPPGAGSPLWESPLFIGGAADDPDVIRAAQELWRALGHQEYAKALGSHPRTARGQFEGRAWLLMGVLILVGSILLTISAVEKWGPLAILAGFVPAGLLALLWRMFRRRYERGLRKQGAELPHL